MRRYYIYRNAIYVHKMYKKYFPNWCRYDKRKLLISLGNIILFEKQKINKVNSIAKGIYHGIIQNFN